MLKQPYLILDCNYLLHRAAHVFGDLVHGGHPTGAIYGFLKDIIKFQEFFQTNKFLFCWDSFTSIRQQMSDEYQSKRRVEERSEEEMIFFLEFNKQKVLLQKKYLKQIGFRNVYIQNGYEGDDMIAMACEAIKTKTKKGRGVIISADQDLYQLISNRIEFFNPRSGKFIDRKSFKAYGITPRKWAWVKAIGGCSSDNIKGIKGVGEITALKYLKGELHPESQAYQSIERDWDIVIQNMKLVRLPLDGAKPVRLMKNKVTQQGWNKVTKAIGMQSIRWKAVP